MKSRSNPFKSAAQKILPVVMAYIVKGLLSYMKGTRDKRQG